MVLIRFSPQDTPDSFCSQEIIFEIEPDRHPSSRLVEKVSDLHFEDGRNGPGSKYDAALYGIEHMLTALLTFGVIKEGSVEGNMALDAAIRDIWDQFNDT